MKIKLIPVVVILLWLSACGESRKAALSQKDEVPLKVRSVQVQAVERMAREEVPGTLRAVQRAVIEAKIGGRVKQLLAKEGLTVREGEVLIVLDAGEIEAKLAQAKAAREQADRDLERYRALINQKAVTAAEFDGIQARARMTAAAEREAAAMLGYAEIKAPFNGVVTAKYVEIGDLALPGKPLIEIENPVHLRFEAAVPESTAGVVKIGDELSVRLPALARELRAQVTEISPVADPISRTVLIKADLPSVSGLKSGQFGYAAVPTGREVVITVPHTAVVQRGQMELVFLPKDGRAVMRLVRTGRHLGSEVEILAGLEAGEEVIAAGAADLRDGSAVEMQS